jgi:outer membrane protein assembly factor BamB
LSTFGKCNASRRPTATGADGNCNTGLREASGHTLARVTRRAWLIGGMSLALVASAAVAYARTRDDCGDQVTSLPASRSSSPFLSADQRAEQPDRDRDRLVTALEAAPNPFGAVLGAVGYHYEQWARVEGFAQGIGVRTRDNPDFTMLDDTLKPRWSVQVDTKRSTYDASDRHYLVATMPAASSPDLVAIDADNGHRLWCSTLGEAIVGPDDPFATQILDDEDVVVLGPGSGRKERLVRLDGRDGSQLWQRTLDADSGDYLGELSPGKLLLGGREQFRLFDSGSVERRPAGTALVLVSAGDGKTIWTRPAAKGSDLHVLGTDPDTGTAVAQDWSTRSGSARLIAIDSDGTSKWSVVPARGEYFDAALRSGRILVRAKDRWSAYSVEDGHRLWTRELPDRPQLLPYGFELDSISMLDDEHALLGTTTALRTLDLGTGAITSTAPLPRDGINTTYWPYQVAVGAGLIAVATNTGAVVVRRTSGGG